VHCGGTADWGNVGPQAGDDGGAPLVDGAAADGASLLDGNANNDGHVSDGYSPSGDAGPGPQGGGSLDGSAPSTDGGTAAEAGQMPDGGLPGDGGGTGDGGPTPSLGKVVGGYYPNWTPSPVRIKDVDPHYNLIYLFAATPVGGSPGHGAIEWMAPGDGLGAATNLVADIAYARQTQGRKIVLSIGGAGQAMSFPDRATSQTFVSSVEALYTQLGGFDGIDWDTYEGSDSPDTSEMIWISLQLKSSHPGFLITSPPAPWSTVDQTFCSSMAAAGALDYCAPQYYDGPGLAVQSYVVSNVDTWAALLGDSKVVVGFGISNAANYMTVAQVVSTWQALEANHPNLGGAFDWSIETDESTGWPFATEVGPLVSP
jgi:chitinase